MNKKLLFRLFALMACLLCSLGAAAAEAYANYTPSNTTLTFYYDNLRSTRTGTTYDLNEGENYPEWFNDLMWGEVTRVVFNSSFADARPTSTYYWFGFMDGLQSITGLQYLNTTEVTTMESMFDQCEQLTALDVSRFATGKVTSMRSMFSNCMSTTLDLSSFNTANVTDMSYMFSGCSHLTTIEVSRDWETSAVTSSTNMFVGCTNIRGEKGTTYDASHVNKDYACIDEGTNGRGYLSTGRLAYACFTESNSTLTFYFDKQSGSRPGSVYYPGYYKILPEAPFDCPNWYDCRDDVTRVVFNSSFTGYYPTDTHSWFTEMSNLTSVTGLNYLNTSQVTDMNQMFRSCSGLTTLDLSGFNTANVTDMYTMFFDCSGLRSLDLSSFNTANVTTMIYMFSGCSGLTSLDLSGFNTANVTDMQEMFSGCTGLSDLDLSNFNTVQVYNMRAMFRDCTALPSLDLSSFNTSKMKYASQMFSNCSNLRTIYVGDQWDATNLLNSNEMFTGCTNLVGDKGTAYDPSHTDKAYAHIDGGPSNPGYLSDINASTEPEAYACYTPSNTTLTFYYDTERSTRTGTTYDLNEENNAPVWYTDSTCRSVTKVVFNSSFAGARPTTAYRWFADMNNLTAIANMSNYLNTSQVTNMQSMFSGCFGLTSLNVSNFNTANVTNMSYMFYRCSGLTSLNVSNFNTANVSNMSYMFSGCSGLTNLNVSNFNTANVANLSAVFQSCSGLTSLNVSNFSTTNVTNMNYLFNDCSGLTSLDLSSFNTTNVTAMAYLVAGCTSLMSLNLSSFNTAKVKNMASMFRGCTSLTTLDLSSFNTGVMNILNNMFLSCSELTTVYVGEGWTTNTVSQSNNMFTGCTKIVGGQGTTYDASHVNKAYAHIDGGPSNPGYFTAQGAQPWTDAEAYACYTPSNTTLTFYCDNQRSTRTGTTYNMNTGNFSPGWYTDGTYSSVTKVVFDPSFAAARPTSAYHWFYKMSNLTSITGISYLNTSDVTSMTEMFSNCSSLTSLDVSHFNTANVTSMSYMFEQCRNLTSLDVSNFNTANVTGMRGMFLYCSSLTSLDVSHFNTENALTMMTMFSYCSSLTSLDLSSFNTAKVTNMQSMFYNCTNLTSLDLSTFNTAKVTNMSYMFKGCSKLSVINVGDGWSTAAVTTSTEMFLNCNLLVGDQGTTYDANHTDGEYAHIDGGPANPGYLSAHREAYVEILLGEEEEEGCLMTFYYDNLRSTRTGTTYDLNEGDNDPGWYSDGKNAKVTMVDFDPSFAAARPTSAKQWFSGMEKLTSITGLNYLNTSEVTNMMSMFYNCSKLTSLDVTNFNTSNVTTMAKMFSNCPGLTSLDLSHFNTSNVTTMANMFSYSYGLKSLDLSHFNTENVKNMYNMFFFCMRLKSLDLSSFNTAKVTNMNGMFFYCANLTSLDLSSFITSNVKNMASMFDSCSDLTTIYVGDGWSTAAVTSSTDMFLDCINLVGGQGTTYDANHVNKDYAHIDGGTANPGYFTDINAPTEPVAYVHYNPENTTLTFYYNSQRGNRDGTSYYLNEGFNDPGWYSDGSYVSVTRVVFDPSFADARPTSTCSWFWGMTNLQSITGMEYLNTSEVTTMWGMFANCSSLTTIDASSFNTANVTNALSMFDGCTNLTTIYGGDGWITSSMSVSNDMFNNCVNLVGGKGTTYDPSHTNKYYAHIDGGPSNPGYFTANALRGDVNGDGFVNITDVTTLINYLLTDNASGVNLTAADCSQDGNINISDVTKLINYLLTDNWN